MPKKFVGENSKAAAARDRKETAKTAEKDKKTKAADDAYWAEDDKNVLKKFARKDEEEKKKAEAAKRKEENRKAAEEEMKQLGGKSAPGPAKVTQAVIASRKEAEKKAAAAQELQEKLAASKLVSQPEEVEENRNVLDSDAKHARNVDDAIAVLDSTEADVDKHPEKRMKAAYDAFSDANLPRLKEENPSLRLSQLKQMLRKEWQKAPENPLNAKLAAM